jgi:transposase
VAREKGRFRSFLLASLQYFLADERDKVQAQKRGGGHKVFTFDGEAAERGYLKQAAAQLAPESLYDKRWAVIAEQAQGVIHILDRFHIMANLNKAIDKVRAEEARRLKADGYEQVFKHSRWCLLKRPENCTETQAVKLSEILQYNLQTVRAYLHREDFQQFWEYQSPTWAGYFLDGWCQRVMRSRIEPLKKQARTLLKHRDLILNWFRARGTISAGVVEGLNYNAKLTMKKAYGFRTPQGVKMALYHRLGALPEPEFTHRFS